MLNRYYTFFFVEILYFKGDLYTKLFFEWIYPITKCFVILQVDSIFSKLKGLQNSTFCVTCTGSDTLSSFGILTNHSVET